MAASLGPLGKGMSDTAQKAPGKVRRRNVDRSAATRALILEATIRCLHKQGYGAVTNHAVADLAGVSRGAMMHHFPSRQALLVATVDYAYEQMRKHRLEVIEGLAPGLTRYRAIIDLVWDHAQRPEEIAVNEIRFGSRSDPEIAAAVTPIMSEVADNYGRFVGEIAHEAGLEPDEELRGLTLTTAFALRSLTLNRFTYPRPQIVEMVLNTLRRTREAIIARQLGPDAAIQIGRCDPEGPKPPATKKSRPHST